MESWPVSAHFLVTSLGTNLVQFIQIRYKMTLNYPMIKLLKNYPLPILYAYGLANSTRQKGSFLVMASKPFRFPSTKLFWSRMSNSI